MHIHPSANWSLLREGTVHLGCVSDRIAMLNLSLRDCALENMNVHVKEYEKECLYDLYPNYGNGVESIQV